MAMQFDYIDSNPAISNRLRSESNEFSGIPLLTLVVATYERPKQLHELLCSIPRENITQIEVVVVDQAKDDALSAVLASHACRLTLVYQRVDFQNASRARNFGASLASAEWVAFPDDDALLLPDTLSSALRWIKRGDSKGPLDLIAGCVVDDAGRPHILPWLNRKSRITETTLEHTLTESSFFIRRDIFFSVGGFDPLFGPGAEFPSAEGNDLVRRLWQTAKPLRTMYSPAIQLYHPDKSAPNTVAARERIYRFAMGEGAYVARHFGSLPKAKIAKNLLFWSAACFIRTGELRRRRVALLSGFLRGVRSYLNLRLDGNDRATGTRWWETRA